MGVGPSAPSVHLLIGLSECEGGRGSHRLVGTRETNDKNAATTGSALNRDGASHQLRQPATEVQAQTGALLTGTPEGALLEFLENSLAISESDPSAGIDDSDQHAVMLVDDHNCDAPTWRRELN